MSELNAAEQEQLDLLDRISLPNSLEWMDANLPEARTFIEEQQRLYRRSMHEGDKILFEHYLEKYAKAWCRVWTRMALEHFETRGIEQTDMRYFRHLPDGYSFDMDSSKLGCVIRVFPRKPKTPPNMLWITASEMLTVHEHKIIGRVIEKFDAWFLRDKDGKLEVDKSAMERSKARAAKIHEDKTGKKFKGQKKGWDLYE